MTFKRKKRKTKHNKKKKHHVKTKKHANKKYNKGTRKSMKYQKKELYITKKNNKRTQKGGGVRLLTTKMIIKKIEGDQQLQKIIKLNFGFSKKQTLEKIKNLGNTNIVALSKEVSKRMLLPPNSEMKIYSILKKMILGVSSNKKNSILKGGGDTSHHDGRVVNNQNDNNDNEDAKDEDDAERTIEGKKDMSNVNLSPGAKKKSKKSSEKKSRKLAKKNLEFKISGRQSGYNAWYKTFILAGILASTQLFNLNRQEKHLQEIAKSSRLPRPLTTTTDTNKKKDDEGGEEKAPYSEIEALPMYEDKELETVLSWIEENTVGGVHFKKFVKEMSGSLDPSLRISETYRKIAGDPNLILPIEPTRDDIENGKSIWENLRREKEEAKAYKGKFCDPRCPDGIVDRRGGSRSDAFDTNQ